MKLLGLWFYSIFLFAALIFGFLFNADNPMPVAVVFLGIELPELNLGLWLLFSVLLGVLLMLAVSFFPTLALRHKVSSLMKQKIKLEEENKMLKNASHPE